MISASRSGRRPCRCKFWRMYFVHSGMFSSQNLVDGASELLPRAALPHQRDAASRGQPVEAAAALTRLLHPPAQNQALRLQTAQDRVQRAHAKLKPAPRPGFDELSQLVTMPGTGLQQGQDQEFGAALLEFAAEHGGPSRLQYTSVKYTSKKQIVKRPPL